jgi:hypothetical protein
MTPLHVFSATVAEMFQPSRAQESRLFDDLAGFGKTSRDHARFAGLEDRVAELILRRCELIVGRIERGLSCAKRLLGLVEGRARREAAVGSAPSGVGTLRLLA